MSVSRGQTRAAVPRPSPPQAVTAAGGQYIRRLGATSLHLLHGQWCRPLLWAAFVQSVIDVVVYEVALFAGVSAATSHLLSFAVAFPVSSTAGWSTRRRTDSGRGRQVAALALIGLLAVFLRGGVLALALKAGSRATEVAVIPAALVAALVVFSGRAYITVVQPSTPASRRQGRRLLLAGAVLYLVVLRLVYISVAELIPEEAYYWNYAQHLDWSYLDHPPMVAWIIGLGSVLFGSTEFGVRIGAFCCWFVTAAFAFALARDLFDRTAAVRVVLLVAALPFFFGIGLVATPDAALTAAWAAALFFLGRALLGGRSSAWLGVGATIGLGLLAKYTIALLIPAAVLFMLQDSKARRWWIRPQPYLAAALAGMLFLPVIYWNWRHEWASFLFQTAGRLRETAHFSVHELLGAVLFLLTPTGLLAAIIVLRRQPAANDAELSQAEWTQRCHRFIILFTLTPLIVFAIFSLRHHTKLNWTGPIWLAVLPAMAAMTATTARVSARKLAAIVKRSWAPTIVVLIVLYGGLLHYLVLGLPGVPYPSVIADIAGWKDLQRQVSTAAGLVTVASGRAALVVGMDRYRISSELAFYGPPEAPRQTAGRNLFGEDALMYRHWFPEDQQHGRNIVLVGRRPNQLGTEKVISRFDSVGAVRSVPVRWNERLLRDYCYRIGYGYRAPVNQSTASPLSLLDRAPLRQALLADAEAREDLSQDIVGRGLADDFAQSDGGGLGIEGHKLR